MPLRDTPAVYGKVSRALHWLMALLVIWQFIGMGLKLLLGRESAVAGFFVGSHQQVGTVLFLLILLRLIWAVSNRGSRPPHGEGFNGIAAKAGHGLLYLCLLIVPLVALIRAYGSTRAFAPFGFEIFPAREVAIEWTQQLGGMLHGELAWVMGVLILGHVFMAIYHEAKWRDGTLSRMAGPHRG